MIWALLILNCIVAFIFGFVSNGKGTNTDKLRNITGIIYLLAIVASIIIFIIHSYWIGLLWLALIFFIVPKIGDLLMKEILIKRGYPRDML